MEEYTITKKLISQYLVAQAQESSGTKKVFLIRLLNFSTTV